MDFFIECVRTAGNATVGDQNFSLHGVLVDWGQDDTAFTEASTIVSALQNETQSQMGLKIHRIVFLDWGRLHVSNETESFKMVRWQETIKGYLRYTGGEVRQFTYGVAAREEVLQDIAVVSTVGNFPY
jgi:hypothetical protein